eukprot:829316-Prymnesium_polylepis.1
MASPFPPNMASRPEPPSPFEGGGAAFEVAPPTPSTSAVCGTGAPGDTAAAEGAEAAAAAAEEEEAAAEAAEEGAAEGGGRRRAWCAWCGGDSGT